MPSSIEQVTVLVVRSGGFGGLRRAWRVRAEGTDAQEWLGLVRACPWDAAPGAESGAGADRFCWEVIAAGTVPAPDEPAGASDGGDFSPPDARAPSGISPAESEPATGNGTAAATEHRAVLAETDVAGPWRDLIEAVRAQGEPCAPDSP